MDSCPPSFLISTLLFLSSPCLVFWIFIIALDFGSHLFPVLSLWIALYFQPLLTAITALPTVVTLRTSNCILTLLTALYSSCDTWNIPLGFLFRLFCHRLLVGLPAISTWSLKAIQNALHLSSVFLRSPVSVHCCTYFTSFLYMLY